MIIILASRYDKTAEALVARWDAYDARVLTCEDLSAVGWHCYLSPSRSSTYVVGGQEAASAEIIGVLTRLPNIWEQELLHVVPADRTYVATEMTAFLVFWLSGLTCPVLNRPTPSCLSGSYWRLEQWVHAAARLGIPVRPVRRRIVQECNSLLEDHLANSVTVTVVGDRCLGKVDKSLAIQARRLADVANVDLLAVQFSGSGPSSSFINAHLWPDVANSDVADAVIEYFQQRHSR